MALAKSALVWRVGLALRLGLLLAVKSCPFFTTHPLAWRWPEWCRSPNAAKRADRENGVYKEGLKNSGISNICSST